MGGWVWGRGLVTRSFNHRSRVTMTSAISCMAVTPPDSGQQGMESCVVYHERPIGSSTLCSKNDLLCYSLMFPNVAYYAIDSHPLFHIMLQKFSEIRYTTQNSSFRVHSSSSVHRPFSTTVQQITRDVTLAVSTVRECDSPPL